jgi:hypothetical protein
VVAAKQALAAIAPGVLDRAGFGQGAPVRTRTRRGYWIDTGEGAAARAALDGIGAAVASYGAGRTPAERGLIDYAIVAATGYPGYLGGPLTLAARR